MNQLKALCRWCKQVTKHQILNTTEVRTDGVQAFPDEPPEPWGCQIYKTIQCLGCDTVTLLEEYSSEFDTDENGNPEVFVKLYPNISKESRAEMRQSYFLPDKIGKAYKETIIAYNNSLNVLVGIGLRLITEALCLDLGINKGNLNQKIDQLVEKGLVTSKNAEMLHLNRNLGNDAAHEIIQSDRNILEVGLEIIEAALLNAYVLPKKLEQAKMLRENQKKKKTESL